MSVDGSRSGHHLTGQVAIATGAKRGIERAAALANANARAHVMCAARSTDNHSPCRQVPQVDHLDSQPTAIELNGTINRGVGA